MNEYEVRRALAGAGPAGPTGGPDPDRIAGGRLATSDVVLEEGVHAAGEGEHAGREDGSEERTGAR